MSQGFNRRLFGIVTLLLLLGWGGGAAAQTMKSVQSRPARVSAREAARAEARRLAVEDSLRLAVRADSARTDSALVLYSRALAQQASVEQAQMHECVRLAQRDEPGLSGVFQFGYRVSPEGKVIKVWIEHSTLHNRRVERCLIYRVHRWEMPPAPPGLTEPVDITGITYEFSGR